LPFEVDVDVVGLVVEVEVVVVVGDVVFVGVVVEPLFDPGVFAPVVVGELKDDAAEATEEALAAVLLLLFAITTIATTKPTMIAIRPAISKWMLPWGPPPSSGPMICVGSSCT
jgi:hypothetical protein